MDPDSAFNIASATASFVAFASQLLSTTSELFDSEKDTSAYIRNLDTACSHLDRHALKLSQALQRAARDQAEPTSHATENGPHHHTPISSSAIQHEDPNLFEGGLFPELRDVYSSLEVVLGDCELDSRDILHAVLKLKSDSFVGSLGLNFMTAFKTVWKRGEIKRMEARLRRSKGALATTVCHISNIYHSQHSRELAGLRTESERLGVKHSPQFSDMQDTLEKIEKNALGMNDTNTFTSHVCSLGQMMGEISVSESKIRTELEMLRSLNFKMRQCRHNSIPEAHQETFRWAFAAPKYQKTRKGKRLQASESKLIQWLEHGSGVFWVSGKPGSGKSTFMKFVANHPKTTEALSKWSHPLQAVTSCCYFWNAGTDIQKSLTGLLQTLLYDVFRCCPRLIQDACPSRWSGGFPSTQNWTEPELRATLERISEQPEIPFRFCFFIDGLDEFNGNHLKFCEYLTTILNKNVKLCLSSRPWNVFKDAFGHNEASRIFIHELTRNDIFSYAQDRLHKHPLWHDLRLETGETMLLTRTIAERSQGVFLWVFLATQHLRKGLTKDDNFAGLEKKLCSFPTELEAFFKKMLESVPLFYHEKMAGALKVALYANQPLDPMVYSFLDDEYADPDYYKHLPAFEETEDWARLRQERTIQGLKMSCRGLLEEQLGKITFLHRTVFDFLRTRQMSDFLDSKNTLKGFNAGVSILKAYTAWLKTCSLEHGNFTLYEGFETICKSRFPQSSLYSELRRTLKYALDLESDPEVPKKILDSILGEIDSALKEKAFTISPAIGGKFPEAYDYVANLCRLLALELPLMGFLSRKLSENPSFLTSLFRSPISLVLWTPTCSNATWPILSREKLECVLKAGANPNEEMKGTMQPSTIWEHFLSEILVSNLTKFQATLEQGLIQTFLDYGANPRARLWVDKVTVESAFSLFVAVGFEIQWSQRIEQMYFQSLIAFMRGGASFDSDDDKSTHVSMSIGFQETLLESTEELEEKHSVRFFERFTRAVDAAEKSSNESRRLFISRLTQKIVPLFERASWRLGDYQNSVNRALHIHEQVSTETGHTGSAAEMARSSTSRSPMSPSTKRRVDTSEDSSDGDDSDEDSSDEENFKRQKQDEIITGEYLSEGFFSFLGLNGSPF